MNVLHIWRDYTHNLFDCTNDLCNANGISSKIVCLNEINGGGAKTSHSIISVHKLSRAEVSTPSLVRRLSSRVLKEINRKAWLKILFNQSNRAPPDLLHFHFGFSYTALRYQNVWDDLPIIVSFYGVDAGGELFKRYSNTEYRKLFKRKNFLFLCLTRDVYQRLVKMGCPENNIRIFDLPIDLDSIPLLPFLKSQKTFNVLMAARFIEKKGHLYALKAIKSLLEIGHDVTLTIFGYGPDDWLLRLISDFGLQANVKLINNNLSPNFIGEYVRHLGNSDLVIAPSVEAKNGDDEAGPALTIVMAQAASKPVIVSNFAGHERSVFHMKTGLVVPMRDEFALANSIETLLNNSDLRKLLGDNSATFVRKNFSRDIFFSKLKAAYQELINE